jgi:hypothetical protein
MSCLSHLTHVGFLIHMDGIINNVDDVALINTVIQHAASISASLKYFRLRHVWQTLRWMMVERNEDGSYKGSCYPKHAEEVSEDY